jgi:hypothetical protein
MLEIDGRARQFNGRSVHLDISFELRAGEYVANNSRGTIVSGKGH